MFNKKNRYRYFIVTGYSPLNPLPFCTSAAYSQTSAITYLQANSNNPWVTMALSAAGASSIPSDYLKSINSTKATDYETTILAIASLGQDPRTFGSSDYIAKLESFYTSGQIGDPNLLNDDFFGILALVSAGVPLSDSAITDSRTFYSGAPKSGRRLGLFHFGPFQTSNDHSGPLWLWLQPGLWLRQPYPVRVKLY